MPSSVSPDKKNISTSQTSGLQRCLESIWYEGASGKQCLYPLEWLYRALAFCDRVIKKKQRVDHPIPILIVGNISIGGTGKTPLVVYLCELLISAGYSPGIITRGYGGRSNQWPASVDKNSDPVDCGDEPVLMAQRTGSPVVAGPDRNQNVTKLLEENTIDVVISDDGLQHYRLQRDIEIVVIDKSRGLGNRHCLPAGPLREPESRLKSCDFVVVNEVSPEAEYSMQLQAQFICSLNSAIRQPLSSWKGLTVHAVTGIGNPSRFFVMLSGMGLQVIEHSFPDHYPFEESDITFTDGFPVVMTEKDAVKCRAFATSEHWSIPITAELNERFSQNLLAQLATVASAKLGNQNV